ncbi:MAG: hypothetical protein VKJ04_11595 [Vampirovibrionales bacterium]|nr:hypothetical protein [Vampirovibrionales bacterium]
MKKVHEWEKGRSLDQKLDREDVLLIEQLLLESGEESLLFHLTPEQLTLLDVNEDGCLDEDDIEELLGSLLRGSHADRKQVAAKYIGAHQQRLRA